MRQLSTYLIVFVGAGFGGALRHAANVMVSRLVGIYYFLDVFIGGSTALGTWGCFQCSALRDLVGNARALWNIRRPKSYCADGLGSGQAVSIHH